MIEVSFYVRLSKYLNDEIEKRKMQAASGSGLYDKADAAATGMNYAKHIGYIQGMVAAFDLMEQVRKDLEGGHDDEEPKEKRRRA